MTTGSNASADKRMTQARNHLVLSQPFFGVLALRLQMRSDATVGTMAVDGRVLRYSPEFVGSLTFAELVGVVAHEVMHCAVGHHARLGARDLEDFNVAGDYAINPLIIEAGMTLPAGALINPQFAGKAAEEIYPHVRRSRARNPDGGDEPFAGDVGGCGSFGPGQDTGGKKLSEAEMTKDAQEWQVAVAQAAAVAKRAGSLPGHLSEMIDSLRAPRVNWREQLKRFLTESSKQDYSWLPPNRRYVASGLYLPALVNGGMGELVFVVDTSASMATEELKAAVDELNSILSDVQPELVHVLHADTEVQKHEVFEPSDYPIAVEAMGRGGTQFSPTFEWIAENGINPACLIYFSDMACNDYGEAPGYPVLWASTDTTDQWDSRAPWGEVIKVIAD